MTATYLFSNNATTTLAAPCSSSAVTITLSSGSGAKFPALSTDQAFSITMKDSATGEQTEIMYCTARSGDVCTVVRGEEGTTAQAWTTGDFVSNTLTAGIATLFLQGSSFGTMAAQDADAVAITGGSIDVTTLDVGGVPVLANPLTTKGDILVDNGAASVRLAVGANGRVLTADSTQANGVAWEVIPALPVTTKGDLITDNGSGAVRFGVGTDGQVLTADSTQADGLAWKTAAGLPLTTKGDLLVDTGSGLARLPVGTNGQVLTANSAATDGVDWETPSAGGSDIGAAISIIAKTLRKTINAYRAEPNSDNRALAYAVLTAAKQTNTDASISVWEPDGGLSYGAAWTRDQALMMEDYLDYFSPSEISAIATYWLSKCNLSTGEVPDHISLDGTVHWKPGPSGTWGARAPIDGNFFLMQFFWLHYVMTGAATIYAAHSADLLGLIETGVSYNGSTNCVNISDSAPYVGWGFMDTATLTGDMLYCSILAVRAFQMAAEMEYSLGNTSTASTLLARANLIKAGINSTLVVRTAGSGGYLSAPYNAREIAWGELATTKGVNQVDLWGTAMLVWCDIVSPTDAKAVANFLNYTISVNADNYVRGGLRNITKATDYTANTECYQATWDTPPTYGTYQNGGFWPTPSLALRGALELVQPEAARQVSLDLYSYSREQSSPLLEWWNAAGTTVGVAQYCASTTTLLGASDGPALFVDEWSGLDRAVTNESLTLVMNVSFPGTILATSTQSASGTATATFKINATALGGAANAVSSTEQTVTQNSANRFNAGDNIVMTISSNSSCVDLYFSIKFIRRA